MLRNQILKFTGVFRFLSNFYSSEVEYEGIRYPTAEHAYQAAKTLDRSERVRISCLQTPGDAKRSGRCVDLRENWDEIKVAVMEDILRAKFKDPTLKSRLIETGSIQLEEGNTWGDTFWGVCGGIGENKLGKALMKIRAEIMSEDHIA